MSSQAMNTERVACIKTDGYAVSLLLNAVYDTLPDDDAAKHPYARLRAVQQRLTGVAVREV